MPVSLKYSSRAAATSMTAVACPRPIPFCLSRNADRATADADLDEVRACLRQETESLAVDHVAAANLRFLAESILDIADRLSLELGESLGGIDAQYVDARVQQRRNALFVVTGVDAGSYDISLMGIQKLIRIFLVRIIILAENEMTSDAAPHR